MIDQREYGSGQRPSWKQEDLGKATHAVLTIREVDPAVKLPGDADGDERTVLTLTFNEDEGEKTLYTNYTMVGDLVARLGEDEDKWVGKKVVLKKYTAHFGKKSFPKVGVAPAEEWDGVLKIKPGSSRAKSRR